VSVLATIYAPRLIAFLVKRRQVRVEKQIAHIAGSEAAASVAVN
jgi:hypothetical protein